MQKINGSDYHFIQNELASLGNFFSEMEDEKEIKTSKLNGFFKKEPLWESAKQATGHAKYTHKFTGVNIGYKAHGGSSVYGDHLKGIKTDLKTHLTALEKMNQESAEPVNKEKSLKGSKKNQHPPLKNGAGKKRASLQDIDLEDLVKGGGENKNLDSIKSMLYKKGKNARKPLEGMLALLPLWKKETDESNDAVWYQHEITHITIRFSAGEYQLDEERSREIAQLLEEHTALLVALPNKF